MAGNNNSNGILPVGKPYRPDGLNIADAYSDVFIRRCSSIGDGLQLIPDFKLKRGALRIKFNRKKFTALKKIFFQFSDALFYHRGEVFLLFGSLQKIGERDLVI